jgi:hypothetical protein
MKSRSRCFLLLGFIVHSGRAAAQQGSAFERFDTSNESAAVSRDTVGPQRAPIGFVGATSLDTRDVRTIAGYGTSRKKITTSSSDEFPPGVIGGAMGAVVGGAVGFLRVQMYCEMGTDCSAARSVLTGAAIGAIMGLFVEWVVRSGPNPA